MGTQVRIDPDEGTVSADRPVRSSGRSTVVTLPSQVLEAAGIEEGDDVKLVAKMDGSGRVELRRAKGNESDDSDDSADCDE